MAGEIRGRCSLHRNPKFAEEKLRSPRARSPVKRKSSRAPSPSPSLPPQIPASYRKLWPNMTATKSGELVRDMSNVPCFLQRAEKRETVQERALNFGVLDWRRLERWNDDRRKSPAKSPPSSFDSSTFSAVRSSVCSDLASLDSNLEEVAERKISATTEDDSRICVPTCRKNSHYSRSGDSIRGSRRFDCSSPGDFQFGRLSPSFPRSCPNSRDEEKADLSRCSSSTGRRTRDSESSARSKRSSSPLRRILDPFLKSSKSTAPESPARPISISTSKRQAFLRVSWKDGVPLFTFSITESEILAATKKNETYNFYSVLETKKKLSGSWMKQGSKKELVSEIVGRMNVSSTQSAREFVLLGSDPPRSELAAAVHSNNGATTVILPRGAHGSPPTGKPATLIERWSSRGKCDCGGWDVGCPITILRAGNGIHDRTELFSQGRVFVGMARLREGMYEISFDFSVASLQAFGVCVSLLHGMKKVGLHELLSSRQCAPAPLFGGGGGGAALPPPYFPPLSPVGRA